MTERRTLNLFRRFAGPWLFMILFSATSPALFAEELEYEVRKGDSVAIDSCGPRCRMIRAGSFMDGSFMEGTRITVDTCGILAGRRLECTWKEVTANMGRGWHVESGFTVRSKSVVKRGRIRDTLKSPLVSWSLSVENPMEYPSVPSLEFEARKSDMRFFESTSGGRKVAAHFRWKEDRLVMASEFRKRLARAVGSPDTGLGRLSALTEWIDPGDWNADPYILGILDLLSIRDSLHRGLHDFAFEAYREMAGASADTSITRIAKCKADSLEAWKKAAQPLHLEAPRKVGRLLSGPFYPPLDSPTVFWRDSLLCVIQQDGKPGASMRKWNPRTGAWSKFEKARFPETGIAELYGLYCEVILRIHDTGRNCWTRRLKDPGSLACPAWECSPLLSLADTLPGSTANPEHLSRAGGSSAAGYGRFEFGDGGSLRLAGNPHLSWRVFPDSAVPVFGRKRYEIVPERDYPVVVSPDQEWVAFALAGPGGVPIDLWVSRIRYKDPDSIWSSADVN